MELLSKYGLFLAKIITIVISIEIIALLLTNLITQRKRQHSELKIVHLNKLYNDIQKKMTLSLLDNNQQKLWYKIQKKKLKQESKAIKAKNKKSSDNTDFLTKPRVFVIDFKGSIDAHEVTSLRKEVTAILTVAKPRDQVVLRLESLGGIVHSYGLAASQLQRIRDKEIPLTVTVDKVAASGGYMMACVANRIVAAPFSVIGSIGVIAQILNFNRFLKNKEIDVELHTAGQYKRTLTLLGENTEEGRQKFRDNLNEIHFLFKTFVKRMRPILNVEQVATGEYWYGEQALEKGLIDEISTSDDLLIKLMENHEIVSVSYSQHKKLINYFTGKIL